MLKILVVEDDPSAASLVRTVLEAEGFVSAVTTDIDGAWSIMSAEVPDAAIIDLGLPRGQSGWDLITQIRNSEAMADLPIVVFTGSADEEVPIRAADLRCVYLGKPFSAAALIDRLQIAMQRAGKVPDLRGLQVVLLLDAYRVEGTVHLSGDVARFSDAWEELTRDPREYLPVTDARITTVDGSKAVGTTDLLQIRKRSVRAVAPADSFTAAKRSQR